jgi:REP element-mobilizing transposase RayT
VTFRLADSLPRDVIEALRRAEQATARIDRELDTGLGACWLGRPDVAALVENALLYFDGERYRLLAWCIMPNHVHAVIELLQGYALGSILHSWKSFTANRANNIIGRNGALWHDDYFDRYMRNEEHLAITVNYVEQNPVKAGLVDTAREWLWSSARRRST